MKTDFNIKVIVEQSYFLALKIRNGKKFAIIIFTYPLKSRETTHTNFEFLRSNSTNFIDH
jgi:hypothetical protein